MDLGWLVKKLTLIKRAVSQTALEKRVNYKTTLFPRLKGRFDWCDKKSCVRVLYAKIEGNAGVQWIFAAQYRSALGCAYQ
jgi:hypothetical protein